MPCARRNSSSSPPRPNTNGSPPFSRTTRWPARACSSISAWMSSCRVLWPLADLPTSIYVASRRPSRSTSSLTRRSCSTTSASFIARNALSVSRPASPGPAPTTATVPVRGWGVASSSVARKCCSACACDCWRNRRGSGPASTFSKKRRRSAGRGKRWRMRWRCRVNSSASEVHESSSRVSSCRRRWRASIGAPPPLEMATCSGPRSTMAGTWKLDSTASSTTLASIRRASAAAATARLTVRSPVAAITSQASSRCSGANTVCSHSTRPAACRPANAGVSVGATTRVRAPVRSSASVLRSATAPPPTTSTWRPCRSANRGNSGAVTGRAGRDGLMTVLPGHAGRK